MPIVLLGAHRCGAPLVARLLDAGGAYSGGAEDGERADLRALCDQVLRAQRLDALDLGSIPQGDELEARARAILAELDSRAPWFVSEPSLSLLLPLFRPLFSAPVVVHVTRDPVAVARSMWEHEGLPLPHGLALWQLYRTSALCAAQGLPSTTVSYEELLASPLERAHALFAELGALGVRLALPSDDDIRACVAPLDGVRSDKGAFLTRDQEALRMWTPDSPVPEISVELLETLGTLEQARLKDRAKLEGLARELEASRAETKLVRHELRQLELSRAALEEKLEHKRERAAAKLDAANARAHAAERALARSPVARALAWGDARLRGLLSREESSAEEPVRVPRARNSYDDALAGDAALDAEHEESERQIARWLAEPLAERPLVSVVMPAWDREAIVAESVRSVLSQSYRELELIVVDDGSTDRTVEVVRGIGDPRVRVIEAEHGGAARARNLALKEARGSLIAYLDSDNLWHPSYLDVMVRRLARHPGRLAAYAKCVDLTIEDGTARTKKSRARPFDYEALSDANFVDLNTFVHRRSLYETLGGFDESLVRQQDWDLALEYTFHAEPLYVDAFLAIYRRNEAWRQISSLHRDNTETEARICQKVSAYYTSGIPITARESAARVTVVSWDICRNHFSKAYSVAEILARRHEVQLLGFRFFPEGLFAPFQDETPKFETTYLDGAPFPALHAALETAVASVRGDVVYAVKPRLTSLGVALLANHRTGTPIVLEHNDLESVVTSPRAGDHVASLAPGDVDVRDPELASPYGDKWSRLMQYFAQRVPVTTTHNRNLDRFFGERSFFVRNPKDERFFDPARYERAKIRAELGIAPDARVILFGGLLRRHKGIRELVEVAERLGSTYELLFVASRENEEQRQLEQSSAGPRVRFLGAHNRNEMARINLASDLVVLWLDPDVPASHYQMPYKLTDALAMNVPVIANDISDLGELGARGVLRVCPYGDYAALERTISALFSDDAGRLAMVAAARRLYSREFSYAALERVLPMVLDAAEETRGKLPVSEEFADFFARFQAAR